MAIRKCNQCLRLWDKKIDEQVVTGDILLYENCHKCEPHADIGMNNEDYLESLKGVALHIQRIINSNTNGGTILLAGEWLVLEEENSYFYSVRVLTQKPTI